MEFKGTKGKWKKTTGTFETDLFMVSSDYGVICDIRKSLPLNEQIPNALLISKAPEMLEMLKDQLEFLIYCRDNMKVSRPVFNQKIVIIQQLIKQATEINP